MWRDVLSRGEAQGEFSLGKAGSCCAVQWGDTENTPVVHAEVQPQLHRFHTHIHLSCWVWLPPKSHSGLWHQSKNTEKQLRGLKLGLTLCVLLVEQPGSAEVWSVILQSHLWMSWTRLLPQGVWSDGAFPAHWTDWGEKKARKLYRERNETGTIISVGARNNWHALNWGWTSAPCRSRCVQLSRCWAMPTDISIPAGNKAVTERPLTRWDREITGKGSHRNPSAITRGCFRCSAGLGRTLNPRQTPLATWARGQCPGKMLLLKAVEAKSPQPPLQTAARGMLCLASGIFHTVALWVACSVMSK